MRKSYSSFTIADIKNLGIHVIEQGLFSSITSIEPSDWLIQLLQGYKGIPLHSEKIKSEVLIVPVINEIRLRNPQRFTFFQAINLMWMKKSA